MSGFVAAIRIDGAPADPEFIDCLTAALAFRGPDGRTTRCVGQAGLGHARLSLGSRSANDCQPFSLDGRSWIVADARIDANDAADTDAAHILRACARHGTTCLDRLLGDFTFAVWDASARRLTCACDHLGVRAMYYTHRDPWLVVSNAIAPLRLVPFVSADLDEEAVADFLLFGHKENPSATTFRDIRRVPPAHRLTWSAGTGLDVRRYWDLPIEEPLYLKDDAEYAGQLRELLDVAVADRIRTDRVSIFLSGGLDSTAIAATAARQQKTAETDPVRGYTFLHETLVADHEREAAQAAAANLRIPWHGYVLDRARGWDDFVPADAPEPFLASLDGDARTRCYADAAAHSRVVLDGEGPDNALIYEWRAYLAYLFRTRRWRQLGADALSFAAHRKGFPHLAALLARDGARAPEPQLPPWLHASFVDRLKLRDRWRHVMRAPASPHPVRPIAYFSLHLPAWQAAFDGFDPAYARVPFEVSYPFLDLRVLRFLLRVPVVPWCRDKYLLRCAFRDALPPAVQQRPKTPLQASPQVEKVKRDGLPPLVASPRLDEYGSPERCTVTASMPHHADAALRFIALSRWLARLDAPAAAAQG